VIDRKAEILEIDDAACFRSSRRDMPCPLVIRLVRYVHVPRKFRRQVTNTFLFARDGYRCLSTAAGTARACAAASS
jgi:5-methylcytosine-specific restriction endonuclease McrA